MRRARKAFSIYRAASHDLLKVITVSLEVEAALAAMERRFSEDGEPGNDGGHVRSRRAGARGVPHAPRMLSEVMLELMEGQPHLVSA